jgi:hypothetical protein
MQKGTITLPRPEKELLIEVRSGAWTFERVLNHAQRLFKEVEDTVASSSLPERVDRAAISRLLAQVHLDFCKNAKSTDFWPCCGSDYEPSDQYQRVHVQMGSSPGSAMEWQH